MWKSPGGHIDLLEKGNKINLEGLLGASGDRNRREKIEEGDGMEEEMSGNQGEGI